ncbi:MAG: PAS domain S-box protein [Candidatus Helarchaeota archaeon]
MTNRNNIVELDKKYDWRKKCVKLFNEMEDIIFLQDTNYTILNFNKAFANSFKLRAEKIINRKCYEVVHCLDRPWENCPFEKTLKDKKTHGLELFDPNIGFTSFCITTPVLDEEGEQIGTLHIIRDISRLKQIEKELKIFRFISDNANYGIIISDLDGYIKYVNNYFAEIHGYRQKQVIGKNIKIFHTQEQVQRVIDLNHKLKTKGSYQAQEVWHRHRNGYEFPMLIGDMVITNENKKPEYSVNTAIDISEYKVNETKSVQSEKLAALGKIAAEVAHEINNPIMGIINYAQILKDVFIKQDMDINSKPYSFIDGIIKEGKRISEIVNDLLLFARKNERGFIYTDIISLIKSSISLLLAKLRMYHVNVEEKYAGNIPKIYINPQSIKQVILNVLQNSIDALNEKFESRKGPSRKIITINVLTIHIKKKDYLKIAIKDNGIGIEKENLKKVFDPFFTTKTHSREHGTGLGLNITYQIIKIHEGKIEIQSKRNQYTLINIFLPIKEKYKIEK